MTHQPSRLDYLIALSLLIVTVTALGQAQQTVGVTRDEATYFDASKNQWGFWPPFFDDLLVGRKPRVLTKAKVTTHWKFNSEHPALMKTLFGASWALWQRTGFPFGRSSKTAETSALRFPAWLLTGLAVALIYLAGVRIEGRVAGCVAAASYITMPRLFFHSQLACFDSPVAAMWFMVVYAYLRSLRSRNWGIVTGLLFGLALATKHNAWFVPPLLLIHYLVVVYPDVSFRPLSLPRPALAFVAMATLGPLVFFASWPWLWFDVVEHLRGYFGFHLHHVHYNMEFLGRNYDEPPLPISFPWVMTLFTVPSITLLLAALGSLAMYLPKLKRLLSRHPDERMLSNDPERYPARRTWLVPAEGLNPRIEAVLLLNAVFPLALISLPSTPIFGATKHWLPAYPFVALLAGIGASRLHVWASRTRPVLRLATAFMLVLIPIPGALNILLTHPFGLSQYNAIAGGPVGGANLGLNRQFWGYSPRQLLPFINETAPRGTRVYWHDVNHSTYQHYQRLGRIRADIRWSGMELSGIQQSDIALTIHERHFNKYDYWIWGTYGSPVPQRVQHLDGVPVVSLYRRKGR